MPIPMLCMSVGMLMCSGGPGARTRITTSSRPIWLANGPACTHDARAPAGLLRVSNLSLSSGMSVKDAAGASPAEYKDAFRGTESTIVACDYGQAARPIVDSSVVVWNKIMDSSKKRSLHSILDIMASVYELLATISSEFEMGEEASDAPIQSPPPPEVLLSGHEKYGSVLEMRAMIDWLDHFVLTLLLGPAVAILRQAKVEAVCIHCRDTIPGCSGGEACPLVTNLAGNAAIFAERQLGRLPKMSHMLTPEVSSHFTRPVCEAIVGLACAPALGVEIDFALPEYRSSQAIVQAASYGHCSAAEAACVLAERLEAAVDTLASEKIKGAMDSLKIVSDTAVTATSGVHAYIWAKVSTIIAKRGDGVAKLDIGSLKSKAAAMSVTLIRPVLESQFFESLHFYMMVVVSLGLASYFTVSRFYDEVVYGCYRMKLSWQVAHELFMLYLHEIDSDPTRTVHMGNVFRRGGQDTLLAEAKQNVATFFRTRGETPRVEGPHATVKANGQFNSDSKKACSDFNLGRPCKQLEANGKCKFNHRCNQFVSDKGVAGMCWAEHARCNGCNYADDKKLTKPATA